MKLAIAVAKYAIHFNIFTTLSPFGLFSDILNAILINNLTI